jgi:hypothetical protein
MYGTATIAWANSALTARMILPKIWYVGTFTLRPKYAWRDKRIAPAEDAPCHTITKGNATKKIIIKIIMYCAPNMPIVAMATTSIMATIPTKPKPMEASSPTIAAYASCFQKDFLYMSNTRSRHSWVQIRLTCDTSWFLLL